MLCVPWPRTPWGYSMARLKSECRTAVQIEADKLDLEMYRLVGKMEEFAKLCGDETIDARAGRLFGMRGAVRAWMNKDDRERTGG